MLEQALSSVDDCQKIPDTGYGARLSRYAYTCASSFLGLGWKK